MNSRHHDDQQPKRVALSELIRRHYGALGAMLMLLLMVAAPTSVGLETHSRAEAPAHPAKVEPLIGGTASPQLQPYAGDPIAPLPQPARLDASKRYFTETGHYLSGDFLSFYKSTTSSADLFGLPLTEEFPEQLAGGGVFRVQYFERARLEYHPELGLGQRVQLGLVSQTMLNGRTFPRLSGLTSTSTRFYFPETGHTLSNGFLEYWKTNGGLRLFGYPLSEELGEDGLTVQYFERARFEYHKDLQGTGYAVELSPAGYVALRASHSNLPLGTLVSFEPSRVAEGHTAVISVAVSAGVTVTGEYEGRQLLFKTDMRRNDAWSLIGAVPFQDLGSKSVKISLQNKEGARRTVTRTLEVVSYPFPSESLQFDPETATLLDPTITANERAILDKIFAVRTPEQYWQGTFRMPLDGRIRITSDFATRRCYNCPPGSTPTTYHGGMDMAASEGTSVHAPAAGRIIFAGKLSDRGNAIIIDHGLGVYTLLAHNSKLIASVGQMVQKGDIVSLSGNTGLSNGPHLHWEVHVSGPGVEPLEWVNRAMP